MLCSAQNLHAPHVHRMDYYTTWSGLALIAAFVVQVITILACKRAGTCTTGLPVILIKGVVTGFLVNSLAVAVFSQILLVENQPSMHARRRQQPCRYIHVEHMKRQLLLNTLLHVIPVLVCITMLILNRYLGSRRPTLTQRGAQLATSVGALALFVVAWLSKPARDEGCVYGAKIRYVYMSPRSYLYTLFPASLLLTCALLNNV